MYKEEKIKIFNAKARKTNAESSANAAKKRNEAKQRLKEQEKRRNELDRRYTGIVSVIYNEIAKRGIDIKECNTANFNSKIDEIIEIILSTNVYSKFKKDNIVDIRNAVKRRLNANKNKSEEGPEL